MFNFILIVSTHYLVELETTQKQLLQCVPLSRSFVISAFSSILILFQFKNVVSVLAEFFLRFHRFHQYLIFKLNSDRVFSDTVY